MTAAMPPSPQLTSRIHLVGVDGGGSHTRALAVDTRGRLVGRGQADGSNPHNCSLAGSARSILHAMAQSGATPSSCLSLCLGIAGLADPAITQALHEELLSQAPELGGAKRYLTHDLEIAHRAAFAGQPGVLLVSGTGSACYALSPKGEILRQSGRHRERDDPGSGYSIGKRAIAEGLVAAPGEPSRTQIAALAKQILQDAAFGGLPALELLRQEADALVALARPILQVFPADAPLPIAVHGGLLQPGSLYRELALDAVEKAFPRLHLVESEYSADCGALQFAWQDAIGAPFPNLENPCRAERPGS